MKTMAIERSTFKFFECCSASLPKENIVNTEASRDLARILRDGNADHARLDQLSLELQSPASANADIAQWL